MSNILVNGIVAYRDKMPYIQVDVDGHMVQMSLAEARNVARDIEVMCARTEADAMIHRFFEAEKFSPQATAAVMIAFRDFRMDLDAQQVERTRITPEDQG